MNKKSLLNTIYSFLIKYGIYIAAFIVVLLNASLIFDNVVWGDEAFSANVIRDTDFKGVFERIYAWDSHPILYYYYLKIVASIFGYSAVVYHIASVVPFAVCIVLAVTIIKKMFGNIPAYFFVFISGLSQTCVEYNLEIRMYSLCFLFVLTGILFCAKIFEKEKTRYWVFAVIFFVLSAYTHYYGLVTTGIVLFSVSLIYYIKKKGKTFWYGIISIVSYIILYIPWLTVFFKQAQDVKESWWASEPESLNVLFEFLLGGENAYKVLLPLFVLLFVVYLNNLFGVLRIKRVDKGSFNIKFSKPSVLKEELDYQDDVLFAMIITVVLVICFSYLVCLVLNPILVARYMYPMMPVVVVSLLLLIRKFLSFNDKREASQVEKEMFEKPISKARLLIVSVFLCLIFVTGLFDFRAYRSSVKVQEANTKEILKIVGEPSEDAVFTSLGVQHLSWTVLEYYYPGHKVYNDKPQYLEEDLREIWAYMDPQLTDNEISFMKEKGYAVEEYLDKWMGKYHCHLYHFVK